jgi:hypothetical protein
MSFASRSKVACVGFVSVLSLAFATTSCADEGRINNGDDSVTEVPHSAVKDQSTNNCWIYATTGWAESLHLAATGEELDLSESYLTYWHWFEQIVNGWVADGVLEEGGSWGTAADLVLRYGMVTEKDFITVEDGEIFSKRQAKAVKEVNLALKSGVLRWGASRRNPELVRQVLDEAWQIKSSAKVWIDKTFGVDASRKLDADYATADVPEGVPIRKATSLKAKLRNPENGRLEDKTVLDALGTHRSEMNLEQRKGAFAWQDVPYPRQRQTRRDFWKRVQRALNDKQPVIINWMIDDNSFTADGKYVDVPAAPGPQGGHMVLGFDYAVDNVPGYGSLEAGVLVTERAALDAALDDAAEVRLIRVKNSWSPTYHALAAPAPGGYHDLYVKYLDGPMPICSMDAEGKPILSSCEAGIPLESIVLPAGY